MGAGIRTEPAWLQSLRASQAEARNAGSAVTTVSGRDLDLAIGCLEDGPGGDALISTENGDVVLDFQKLIRAVYLTPKEAYALAEVIYRNARSIALPDTPR